MYSVVLAMALTNGAVTPSYHAEEASNHVRYGNHLQSEQYRGRRRRGGGCCGCCGGGYGGGCYGGGCWGSGYAGCTGGYGGCTGGYAVGYGGCTGGYAMGCTGGYGMGCTGGHVVGYGGVSSGYTMGTWGAPYGAAYEGAMPVYGGSAMPMPAETGTGYQRRYEDGTVEPSNRQERRDERRDNRDNRKGDNNSRRESRATAPATLLVTLPADARLVVDGHTTQSTSAERSFITPALPTDQNFTYHLKATVTRDGRPLTVNREVTVRGGEETRVNLNFSEGALSRR